jgi:hypothetical protein
MPDKIGLIAASGTDPKLAGELMVDGREVTVIIYRDGEQNETFTGNYAPEMGLPGGWSAT